MLSDIEPLKEDSLDEIARLMSDVSRRLDLGRSDDPVVDREQQIIDKLDKMIEKMEEQQRQQQQQQQQQQAQSGGQGGSKSKPMEDSQISNEKGAGDVDRRSWETAMVGEICLRQNARRHCRNSARNCRRIIAKRSKLIFVNWRLKNVRTLLRQHERIR
ncbi:MAG: hypothetical protein R3C05_25410 [Pirellulaceae bacterium]